MFSNGNRQKKCPVCFVQIDKAGQVGSDPHLSIFNPHFYILPSTHPSIHHPPIHPSILSIFVLSGGSSLLAFRQRSDGRITYVALSQSRWLTVGGENTQNTANSHAYGTGLPSIPPSIDPFIHHSIHPSIHTYIRSFKHTYSFFQIKYMVDWEIPWWSQIYFYYWDILSLIGLRVRKIIEADKKRMVSLSLISLKKYV